MRKVIFFDVDGVLVEWTKGFFQYCYDMNIASSLYEDCPIKLTELTGYSLEDMPQFKHMGNGLYKVMRDFISSTYWEQLKPLALMTDLETLKNCGFELHVLGQVSAKRDRPRRAFILSRMFGGVFTDMHFTCHRTKKSNFVRSYAAEFECECWMVDDKPETVHEVAAMSGPTIHSIGICNKDSHPYLLDDFWAMQKQGVQFTWYPDVRAFAEALVKEKYGA